MEVRPFRETDRGELVALWHDCGLVRPWNDVDHDIDRKLAHDAAHLLVAVHEDVVVGSVMVGYDGHRGWLNYLAVRPGRRGEGLGRLLVAEAESRLVRLGCAKVNLQVRHGNDDAIDFYRRIGYTIDEVVGMGRRLIDDRDRP